MNQNPSALSPPDPSAMNSTVPAPEYPIAFAAATAAAPIAARTSAVIPGAGASSITFWCRRCSEQSRSKRCTASRPSPNTWISTCRGVATYFSTSTASLPNAARASPRAAPSARGEVRRPVDPPHPLAAAARHRLDQDRKPDRLRLRRQPPVVLVRPVIPRHHRHAGALHQRLGRVLQPHRPDRRRRRPDEDQPRRLHRLHEPRVLRQEPVARMDRLRPGRQRRRHDRLAAQIALRRRRRPDPHRGVRHRHVLRAHVGVGIDRDRRHPEPPAGRHHPAGDLPAVGDEHPAEHQPPPPGVSTSPRAAARNTAARTRPRPSPPPPAARESRMSTSSPPVAVAPQERHLRRGRVPAPRSPAPASPAPPPPPPPRTAGEKSSGVSYPTTAPGSSPSHTDQVDRVAVHDARHPAIPRHRRASPSASRPPSGASTP